MWETSERREWSHWPLRLYRMDIRLKEMKSAYDHLRCNCDTPRGVPKTRNSEKAKKRRKRKSEIAIGISYRIAQLKVNSRSDWLSKREYLACWRESKAKQKKLEEVRKSFLRRGEICSKLTQSLSRSNEPEMKGASLLSIHLKNLLGDLRWNFLCK